MTTLIYAQSTTVVISQVYGGGGSGTAIYNADYVELHNVSNVAQDISGYKILYGSTSGNIGSLASNVFTFPASGIIIPAGGYYLVATIAGTGLTSLPVTADQTFTLNMSATNGKVAFGTAAIVNNTTLALQPTGSVIDFIGYGTANESETAACSALSSLTAAIRNSNGCDDTNNNNTNFSVGTPNPHNSASTVAICGVTPVPPALSLTSPLTTFGSVCINTTAGPNSFGISGSNLNSGDLTVGPLTGYSFSLTSGGTYTNSLTINQLGGTYTGTIFVKFSPTVVQSYVGTIPVYGAGATAISVAATGYGVDATVATTGSSANITSSTATLNATMIQGCATTISYGIEYSLTNGFTPGTGIQVAASNLTGIAYSVPLSALTQGTTYYYIAYAVNASGTVYGTQSSFTTSIVSTGGSGVVISQVYGGGGSASATFNADYVELHNRTSVSENISGCKLMYGSATGTSFTTTYTFPAGVIIPAGGYLLVASAPSTGLANIPVSTDQTFTFNMSGTNGKIIFGSSALVSSANLAGQTVGTVFDFVGYGTANESETAPVAALSITTAAFRNNNGCDDTNDNLSDFTINTPLPRNSTSPIVDCNSLPVKINSFTVKKNNSSVSIFWQTQTEIDMKEYVVERSVDGNHWEAIARINANSNNNTIHDYTVLDTKPKTGINYYRLKTIELSQVFQYTEIKSVVFNKLQSIIIAPNPAVDFINVNFSNPNNVYTTIELYNANGVLVTKLSTSEDFAKLNTRNFSKGLYVVKVKVGDIIENKKIIIQ